MTSSSSPLLDVIPLLLNREILSFGEIMTLMQVSKEMKFIVEEEAPTWKRLFDEAVPHSLISIQHQQPQHDKHHQAQHDRRQHKLTRFLTRHRTAQQGKEDDNDHDDDHLHEPLAVPQPTQMQRPKLTYLSFFGKENQYSLRCTHEYNGTSKHAFYKLDREFRQHYHFEQGSTTTGAVAVRPCFYDATAQCRNNYYSIARCLRTKTCYACGNLGNYANPKTFKRYCGIECATKDKDRNIIDGDGHDHDDDLQPIGVWTKTHDDGRKSMTHAVYCNHEGCNVSGCLDDIVLHERLQHGTIYTHRPFRYHFENIHPTEPYERISLHEQDHNHFDGKFSHILEGCMIRKGNSQDTYEHSDNRNTNSFQYWDIQFPNNGCQMAIDTRSYVIEKITTDLPERVTYVFEICFQPRPNAVPVQLSLCSAVFTVDDFLNGSGFVESKAFSSFMQCVGLDSELDAVDLLVSFIKDAVDPYCLEDFSQPFLRKDDNNDPIEEGTDDHLNNRGNHDVQLMNAIFQKLAPVSTEF